MLRPGDIIEQYVVQDKIGGGGQGTVYRVLHKPSGEFYALKWYDKDQISDDHKRRLKRLAEQGAPSKHFIWPLATLPKDESDVAGFGYVMPLLEPGYCDEADYFDSCDVTPYVSLRACLELADAFSALHAAGFIYGDISCTNIFINPENGSIRIIDNDNVIPRGWRAPRIFTPDFAAPELIVDKNSTPTSYTDLHSLSVLIFHILTATHPLRGIGSDEHTKNKGTNADYFIIGVDPVYLFDPEKSVNRPHSDSIIHLIWPIYPQVLKNRFEHAFTTGLKFPHDRVNTVQWKLLLSDLLDSIYLCQCGVELVFDFDAPDRLCYRCKHYNQPAVLQLKNGNKVVAGAGNTIREHHLTNNYSDTILGWFETDAQQANAITLKNFTGFPWLIKDKSGTVKQLPPDSSFKVVPETYIKFGTEETDSVAKFIVSDVV